MLLPVIIVVPVMTEVGPEADGLVPGRIQQKAVVHIVTHLAMVGIRSGSPAPRSPR